MLARTYWAALLLLVVCLHWANSGIPAWENLRELREEEVSVQNERSPRIDSSATIHQGMMEASGDRLRRSVDADEFDGIDMELSQMQYTSLFLSGGKTMATPWTDGVVPYTIQTGNFTADQVKWIKRAMKKWEDVTCVRFRPANASDTNKIKIHSEKRGCSAVWGMKGGEQSVNLATLDCFWAGVIEHEFGHALGLLHEHQREQRDAYIRINYYKVGRDSIMALNKYAAGAYDKMGLEYDYESIMHYHKASFSKDQYSMTMYPRDPTKTDVMGLVLKPSFSDAKFVSLLHKCGDKCKSPPNCSNDCFVTADCKCFCKGNITKDICEDKDPSCPVSAKNGGCRTNMGFTITQCRKSCGLCTVNGSAPHFPCVDRSVNCSQWAAQGDCETNANNAPRDCPVSCGECTTQAYTSTGPCKDKKPNCQELAKKGECYRDPGTMLKECIKACDFCPQDVGKAPSWGSQGCEEVDPALCQFRAASGWCQKFYGSMMKDCPKACNNCNGSAPIPANCTNNYKRCSFWGYRGECKKTPKFMLKECQLTCHTCPGLTVPDACIDYDLECPSLAAKGDCFVKEKADWMKTECRRACHICKPKDGTVVPTPAPKP